MKKIYKTITGIDIASITDIEKLSTIENDFANYLESEISDGNILLILTQLVKGGLNKYGYPTEGSINFKNTLSIDGYSDFGKIEKEIVEDVVNIIQILRRKPKLLIENFFEFQSFVQNLRSETVFIDGNKLTFVTT